MAYADFTFYQRTYFGEVLETEQTAMRWLTRASDELDSMTFGRLADGFPEIAVHAEKVRKAVCAMADALYLVEEQRKAAAATKDAQGNYRPAVSSISSGQESISYASNSANGSVYGKAAADTVALSVLLRETAAKYLAGIPDANGINLLYAGVMQPCATA